MEDTQFSNGATEADNIPLERTTSKKWEPSMEKPLPCFRCQTIKKDGERCTNQAPMGSQPHNARCSVHGGALPSVREKTAARVDAARMRLIGDLDLAIDTLESLMEPGTSDAVRLKAATEVMDRGGLRGGIEIDLGVEVTVNSADEVRKNLAKLALGQLRVRSELVQEDDIIEGEVVDDEQGSGSE